MAIRPLDQRIDDYYGGDPLLDEAATLDSTVRSLNNPTGATQALMQALGATARWRLGGPEPTASVGHQLADGASVLLIGAPAIEGLRYVAEAGSGVLFVTYFG
jgi:hypothetical protein